MCHVSWIEMIVFPLILRENHHKAIPYETFVVGKGQRCIFPMTSDRSFACRDVTQTLLIVSD